MNVIDLEILIPASPEFIWRFLGDLSALPSWQEETSSVSFLSTQREGRGTRWRASSDRRSDIVVEISAWYDTLGYEYQLVDGSNFGENQGRVRLHESTDGTLVRWTFQYELGGVLGGLRNAMRIKRSTTNQLQANLRNLHQLIMQESGGISTHEAKASVREAPDVSERSSYRPRHPSTFRDAAAEGSTDADLDFDTDKQAVPDELSYVSEYQAAAVDSDTKPNPVVLAPGYEAELALGSKDELDDTKPVEVEPVMLEPPVQIPRPAPAAEPAVSAAPVADADPAQSVPVRPPAPPAGPRDSANVSVFEIFGLQKPSEAGMPMAAERATKREAFTSSEVPSWMEDRSLRSWDEPRESTAPITVGETGTVSITGLRRRTRRRSPVLRSHT